jgi:hypothetical protein
MVQGRVASRWAGRLLVGMLGAVGPALAQQPEVAPPPRSCEQQQQALEQFESGARQLAVAEGCSDVSQCRAAPVGEQACGGPRDYLVYCTQTTNEQALLQALEVLAQRERRYNEQCDIVSTCVFLEPPALQLAGGACQPAQPAR